MYNYYNKAHGYHQQKYHNGEQIGEAPYIHRFTLLPDAPVGEFSGEYKKLKYYEIRCAEEIFFYLYEEAPHTFALIDAKEIRDWYVENDPDNAEIPNLQLLVQYLTEHYDEDVLYTYLESAEEDIERAEQVAKHARESFREAMRNLEHYLADKFDKKFEKPEW